MTSDPCLCAAGLPIGVGPCKWCGATDEDQCRMLNDITPQEIKENVAAAKRGDKPIHF